MIYLDNAATTKMFEEGADIYKKYACQSFFNPSAGYNKALELSHELDGVRSALLKKLGAKTGNIIFTSGATESNNLAIMGSKRNGRQEYVFSEGEHPSVYNVAKELASQGHIVHFIPLLPDGEIDYEELKKHLNLTTRLISVMHVSNETGAITNLVKVDALRKQFAPNALLHVDGVQAFCKLEYQIDDFNVDFYTISAHKFHGPKGVGALYVRKMQNLKNIVYGGGQEKGFRSGTENVAGIMAMQYAFEKIDVKHNYKKMKILHDKLVDIFEKDEKIKIIKTCNPYIISAEFKGVNGETLMRVLQDNDIIVGMGSACSSKKAGNRVLESIGKSKDEIKSHIRISLCEELTTDEIVYAGNKIVEIYNKIWEKVKWM